MDTPSHATVAAALAADDIAAATALAAAAVKARPIDSSARILLIDCLILAGDFERADRQADMAQGFSPADASAFFVLRQQLRGMLARLQAMTEGAAPTFPLGPTECDRAALALQLALRENDFPAARTALDALEAQRGMVPATVDGRAVDDLRDVDDRIPHALEAITSGGNYVWIDYTHVAALEFSPARRPRDLAYRIARLTLADGSSADVLVPQIYHPVRRVTDAHRLGRGTDFLTMEGGGPTVGLGQRALLAGEAMVALSEVTRIERSAGGG